MILIVSDFDVLLSKTKRMPGFTTLFENKYGRNTSLDAELASVDQQIRSQQGYDRVKQLFTDLHATL